jgi:hypothetical protein
MSAYKMYEANEKQQDANDAAKKAAEGLRSIEETNAFDALQAPDVSRLKQEQNAANTATGVAALQGMGPEGAAQIARLDQAAREDNLKTAEAQAKINYGRDAASVTNEAEIEKRRAEREEELGLLTLEGAQAAATQAGAEKTAAIGEIFEGAGDLATGLGGATSLEAKAARAAKKKKTIGAPSGLGINGDNF